MSDIDPEVYKEIWGEYPAESVPLRRVVAEPKTTAAETVEEVVLGSRVAREAVLAAIEPHLIALQDQLGEIRARLDSLERELKEISNRGLETRGDLGGML